MRKLRSDFTPTVWMITKPSLRGLSCEKKVRSTSREPKAERLFIAGYVVVVTTLAPEILPSEVVLELYQVR